MWPFDHPFYHQSQGICLKQKYPQALVTACFHFVPPSLNLLYYCCSCPLASKMPRTNSYVGQTCHALRFWGENGQSSLPYFRWNLPVRGICFFKELQNTILSICNKSTELRHCHNSENPFKSVIFTEIVWYFLFKDTMWENIAIFVVLEALVLFNCVKLLEKLANKVKFTNFDQYEIVHILSETILFNIIDEELCLIFVKLF